LTGARFSCCSNQDTLGFRVWGLGRARDFFLWLESRHITVNVKQSIYISRLYRRGYRAYCCPLWAALSSAPSSTGTVSPGPFRLPHHKIQSHCRGKLAVSTSLPPAFPSPSIYRYRKQMNGRFLLYVHRRHQTAHVEGHQSNIPWSTISLKKLEPPIKHSLVHSFPQET
jgi:hypothetical protein